MKCLHLSKLYFLGAFLFTFTSMSAFTQEVATSKQKQLTIVVVPICLKEAGDIANHLSISSADSLTEALTKTGSVKVITQKEVAGAMKKANLAYDNVSGKSLGEIIKALPFSHIFITVGPIRTDGWFSWTVARTHDFMGKSASKLLVETKDLDKGFTKELLLKAPTAVTIDDIRDMINKLLENSLKGYMPIP